MRMTVDTGASGRWSETDGRGAEAVGAAVVLRAASGASESIAGLTEHPDNPRATAPASTSARPNTGTPFMRVASGRAEGIVLMGKVKPPSSIRGRVLSKRVPAAPPSVREIDLP